MSGLPQKQIKRLQAVQSAAARTVMKCKRKIVHVTPILRQLHWLPIQKRICHNSSATYRSVEEKTAIHIPTSLILAINTPLLALILRSASASLLEVPKPRDSKTKRYGQRAFMSLPLSGMSSPRASRTPFSLSGLF